MLTGTRVTFVGGDARQLEVINKMVELDATVNLIGFDHVQLAIGGVNKLEMSPDVFAETDVVVLPAVGTDDNGRVETIFSNKELLLGDEHVAQLPKHAKVFTGMAKPYLRSICQHHGIQLVELFERDDVAIYNSIPTAEGALMMAIQHTDFTIHGSTSMVLGLGRTGLTMARVLKGIGARVKAGVRKPEHYARALEMGFEPFYTSELIDHVADVDLLFNTVPAAIVTAKVISRLPHRCLIIDLASKPGGTDFRFAEKRGIKAILAPGLPGIVAPKTAGRIIANTLCQLLLEENRQGRNGE